MNDFEKLFEYYSNRFPWADEILIKCLVKKNLEK
jgi:hypothetical protein